MNKIICYINSNYIDIKKDNHIYHIESDSIDKGEIVDSKKFIDLIKSKKIFSNFITNKVEIYINYVIGEKEIMYYNYIFYELNCPKIELYPTSKKLLKNTIIKCSPIYIIYYQKNYYYVNESKLNVFIAAYNVNKMNVISNKKIDKNIKCDFYYYNNYETYFLN